MMQVRLVCMGRLKERFYIQACEEYIKRLGPLCKLEVIQLAETGDLLREAEAIRKALLPGGYTIALCIEGRQMASDALADQLGALALSGRSKINLIIGSSHGLEEGIKKQADLRLSMSPMTFPHHLARVMLLEQLYRGFSILEGSKYHK